MNCDIIIPVWNELEATEKCIALVREHTGYPYRLILIDNGSSDPARKYLESLKISVPGTVLLRNEDNLGFVKAVNQGMRASKGPYVCLLNNDAFVTKGWLESMIRTVEEGPNNIGMANPDSNIFGGSARGGSPKGYTELDSCRGFCMLIKKEVIDRVGLFDEIYGMGYFEEKDFSMRARQAGYIPVLARSAFVHHEDRLSFDKLKDRDEIFSRSETIYNKRWGRPLNIAFVTRSRSIPEICGNLINKLLDAGHNLLVFSDGKGAINGLKEHINIRRLQSWPLFFKSAVSCRIWKRRRKKHVDCILTAGDKLCGEFRRLHFLHKADVFDCADDAAVISYCYKKSGRLLEAVGAGTK